MPARFDLGPDEWGDALEPDRVVVAVAAGPARGATGSEQPVPL